MRIYEKDYRYLLLHVLPQHRLSPGLRRVVDQALDSGDSAALRRSSVKALEELCEGDYLTRADVRRHNGEVVVGYRKRGGRFQLSLAVPAAEWSQLTAKDDAPATPSAPATPAPPDYRTVTEIIRTFAVPDRSEPILARLESLLETVARLVEVVALRLFVIEDAVAGQETRGDLVRVVSDAELRASSVLRDVVESGTQRLRERAELDAVNWKDVGRDWSVMGIAPIYSMGRVHGALCAWFAPGLERDVMETRLAMATDTIRRAVEYHNQIENMTSIDALTGLYNRHFYDDQMPVEIERAMRSGSVLSMLVIDIDDFKSVNDEMGHKKGDEALAAVSELIRRNLRKVDLPFRYGGEEIVILLPDTSELESVHTAERLRRTIAEYEGFRDQLEHARRLTVSVGVSVYPDTARTADQLFTQADGAMYQAKRQGKNRVVLYREEGETKGS